MNTLNRVLLPPLLVFLASCNNQIGKPNLQSPAPQVQGLLKVTIEGLDSGATANARAEWVNALGSQSIVIRNPNSLSFTKRVVQFYDYKDNGVWTRYVTAVFEVENGSFSLYYNNLTLYAVNEPSQSIGGTALVSLVAGNGNNITDPNIARGIKPTHGMSYEQLGPVVVYPNADLQLLTPAEMTAIEGQFGGGSGIPSNAQALGYGFVARSLGGGRQINGAGCTGADCRKGIVTLAYKFPRPGTSASNPFAFSLYFAVGNDTDLKYSQSLEEQPPKTIAGLPQENYGPTSELRTLAGTSNQGDWYSPICRVITAGSLTSPVAWLGPDPLPSTPGSLDVCFAASGKNISDMNLQSHDIANALAIQNDGKIVVAGYAFDGINSSGQNFFAVSRYNSNGSVDIGRILVGVGTLVGVSPSNDTANAVAIQSDGNIVVGGYIGNGSNTDFAIIRLHSDGSLDTLFDTDGIVTTDFGSTDQAYGMALQNDGKIVLVGRSFTGSSQDFSIARYNNDGTLDTSFDGDGKVTTAIGSDYDSASAVVIQNDGKIVVGGYSFNGTNYDFALVRYNGDGMLDASFDNDGIVTTSIGAADDFGRSVVIQSDGMIVLGGFSSGSGNTLVRYNSLGGLDSGFGTGGIVSETMGGFVHSLALQSDGKIVAGGLRYVAGTADFALTRYTTNGLLDTAFDGDGKVTIPMGSGNDFGNALAIQNDGKIVLAGYSENNPSNEDFALARFNP